MNVIKIEHEKGITLKHLRYFVDSCKDLPDDTVVLLDYNDLNDSTCREIQGDEDSIVFYNW